MNRPIRFALLLLSSLPACVGAVDLPVAVPGSWQTTVQLFVNGSAKGTPRVSVACVDAATTASEKRDAQAYVAANCSKDATSRHGNEWITDRVCSLGKTTVTAHGVTTFTGTSAFHSQSDSQYAPPLAGKRQTRMVVDSKRLGSCTR